jgi:HNH endonuclease
MTLRACVQCGAPFKPRHPKNRHCPAHEQHGREHAGPSTRAQNAEYYRNRRIILANHPACHWCGQPATQADHLTPVARGGSNELSNLVPACQHCNLSRQANPNWQPPERRTGSANSGPTGTATARPPQPTLIR